MVFQLWQHCRSVKSPLGLVLYCYLNMPTINKTDLILVLNKLSRRFLWLSSNFNNDWTIGVSAKACEWPPAAWGSSSLNQCLTHNKCSWCLSCNLSPSLCKFLVPRVRASFLSDKCGNVLQYLQYISCTFSSKTT